jgi:hypothetical protein
MGRRDGNTSAKRRGKRHARTLNQVRNHQRDARVKAHGNAVRDVSDYRR